MDSEKKYVLRRLAIAWNNLDARYLEDILDENVVYESQWVFIPIEGKNHVLEHLTNKFKMIEGQKKTHTMEVFAEMATHPSQRNQDIVVLSQMTKNEVTKVSLLVQLKNRKISRIDVCFIPDPESAILSGDRPK